MNFVRMIRKFFTNLDLSEMTLPSDSDIFDTDFIDNSYEKIKKHTYEKCIVCSMNAISDDFYRNKIIDYIQKNKGEEYYYLMSNIIKNNMDDWYKLQNIKKLNKKY